MRCERKVLREIQCVLSRLTGRGMCELYRQVGAVWGRRPWSWDVAVLAGLFQEGEKLVELVVLWLPCWPISCHSSSTGCWADGAGGGPFFLNQPRLSSLSQAPAAPSVFTVPRRRRGPWLQQGWTQRESQGPGGWWGTAQPETDYVCFLKLPTRSYRVTAHRSRRDSRLMPF